MAFYDPVTWIPILPWLLVTYLVWDALVGIGDVGYMRKNGYIIGPTIIVMAVYTVARNWAVVEVSNIVPDPYLDEIFHIPQAQAYCQGDFHVWDPKLTTPPGLYVFTTIYANLAGVRNCDVDTLRSFNVLALVFTMVYVGSCYASIDKLSEPSNASALHKMFNIALFPPLFFFSGLFYTDVLSTAVVIKMYRDFLQDRSGISLYFTGIVALTMRQTNIFWTAVFLGGLEVVRTLKDIKGENNEKEAPKCSMGLMRAAFHRYERGEIHDLSLKEAEVEDFFLCAVSIGIAVIFNPLIILRRIWPYIAILVSFALFVLCNGGVVLENHVATIHAAQLLYLWPFLTFFSLPLLVPSIKFFLLFLRNLITNTFPTYKSVPLFKRQVPRGIYNFMHYSNATIVVNLIIATSTIIHPFTLADNRHYMFYIFRYTILRHFVVKYLLGPLYILCFYLCYTTLSSSFGIPEIANALRVTTPATKKLLVEVKRRRNLHTLERGQVQTTSFFLIYFLATALSLITAPLVEPRYFILPFVIFRLHLPSLSFPTATTKAPTRFPRTSKEGRDVVRWYAWEGHDPRLWAETFWFAAINGITMWVFLYKGFEWSQEPGKVQRFMW